MVSQQQKLKELDRRVRKLEDQVFGRKKGTAKPLSAIKGSQLRLEDLENPTDVLSALRTRIRKVGYWSLVLVLLYFAAQSLTYSHIMGISKQLKKPVSYDWLNTEFHRKEYSGLVRSESIPGSKERAYTLNEPGRRKVEAFLAKLTAGND